MHLVIVSAIHYPDGGPTAVRHLAIASGLAANGHRVSFILLHQTDLPDLGDVNGSIHWVSVAPTRTRSRLRWRLAALSRLGPALDLIIETSPVHAILLIDRDPVLMEGVLRTARARAIPVLHELSEYPDVVGLTGVLGKIALVCFVQRHLPALDGVLVITHALQEYVAERASVPTQLIGSIVDLATHQRLPPLHLDTTFVVGYAGSLSQEKDGVLSLLRAAARAAPQLAPELDLRIEILGETNSLAGRLALRESELLRINDRVTFHGRVPHSEVSKRLSACHVLVLPRPSSRQASGGFPTKLGEYLSTARPVLTTAVGEIPLHLRHGETCVMVAPDDVAALARSLVDISRRYSEAQAIGAAGRELVEKSFAATVQVPTIVSFIERLRGATK